MRIKIPWRLGQVTAIASTHDYVNVDALALKAASAASRNLAKKLSASASALSMDCFLLYKYSTGRRRSSQTVGLQVSITLPVHVHTATRRIGVGDSVLTKAETGTCAMVRVTHPYRRENISRTYVRLADDDDDGMFKPV